MIPPVTESDQAVAPVAQRRRPVAVVSLAVDGLFGQFDYVLPDSDAESDLRDLFILYGDNGSGKTTILKILFHLLSPADNRGHRSSLKRIPFRRFQVSLSEGTTITLLRASGLVGAYTIDARRGANRRFTVSFGAEGERAGRFETDEQEKQFLDLLNELNLTVYFLSAERRVESDSQPDERDNQARFGAEDIFVEHHVRWAQVRVSQQSDLDFQTLAVIRAMDAASTWIKDHALEAANRGTDSSHNIYADMVKRLLAAPAADGGVPSEDRTEALKVALRSLAKRTQEYARYGFVPPLSVNDMIDAISTGQSDTVGVIERLLEPYIQGANARLRELQVIHNRTRTFVQNLNAFFAYKTVHFDVSSGFVIRLQDGTPLRPQWLSSGEKHLLLLFCHTLISNDRSSIFIIDEPELSLNIKWQRRLINSLLEVVRGSDVQFILATHAIELLSGHRDKVLKLDPLRQRVLDAGQPSLEGGVDQANNS